MPSLTNVTIGQYYHRSSLVHQLDPRTKLACLLFIIISVFLVKNPIGFLVIASFLLAVIFLSHLPLLLVLRGLLPMAWLLASIMLLHVFFADGGFRAGLYSGIRTACRFLLIVISATVLTLTTEPLRLAGGLAAVMRPLRRLVLPVHQFPMMVVITLHFIPVLFTEAARLMSAQKARGAQLASQNPLRRLKALTPVLAPLLRSSLRKADKLAAGMESRCYHAGDRSHLYELKFRKSDAIALMAAAAMIPFALVMNTM